MPKAKSSFAPTAIAAMVGLLLVGSGGFLAYSISQRPAKPRVYNVPTNDEEAIAAARESLLKYLKWPDDAEFLGGETVKPDEVRPRYFHVDGKVKAANTFGAKLTHNYTVQVRRSEHGKWSTHFVHFGDDLLFSDPWPKK